MIPWRQAFPDLKDEDMPGLHLQAARHPAGLTQMALSQKTDIPQRYRRRSGEAHREEPGDRR